MPENHPFAVLHETHSGVVFALGDRVYKVKKPIHTGFLDFRTRDARRAVCEREVDLNRRLAPDVYLGVVDLPDPAGDAPEPVVVMRRMPESARLSTLVGETGAEHHVTAVADIVARFHTHARRGPDIDADGTVDAVRTRWLDNIDETRALDQHILSDTRLTALEQAALRYLDGRAHLFAERIADRRIVDGHGDLLSDDIFCLPDGPRILDCLEFDDRLRHLDEIDDIACLAMDLDFLGRADLARLLFEHYTAAADDPAPASLRHHYVAYRAFMRAKVDCVRHQQGRAASADDARRHTDLAEEHLRRGAVRLAVVGGLPATGKSTLARALADAVGARLISSDAVRRDLFADDRHIHPDPGFRCGRYSESATERVYDTLLDRARHALDRGESVVLDASWTDARRRRRAGALAETCHADLVPLRCTAPPDLTTRRLRDRATHGDHDSEATPEIAAAMAARADDWTDATDIDTTAPLEQSVRGAVEIWDRRRPLNTSL